MLWVEAITKYKVHQNTDYTDLSRPFLSIWRLMHLSPFCTTLIDHSRLS